MLNIVIQEFCKNSNCFAYDNNENLVGRFNILTDFSDFEEKVSSYDEILLYGNTTYSKGLVDFTKWILTKESEDYIIIKRMEVKKKRGLRANLGGMIEQVCDIPQELNETDKGEE